MQLIAFASSPGNLRTNALKNPVMVDTPAPKFSWTMGDDLKRGTVQSSYRIIITDTAGRNVWDSGVREGDDNFDIEYEGPSLQPLNRYYWSVTTVDSNGKEEKSSEKAWFETGLMDSGWDNAKWITPSLKKTEESGVKRYAVEADIEIANVSAGIIFGAKDHSNYYMWQFNLEDGYPRFRPHHWTNNAAACDAEIDLRGVKEFSINKPFHVRIEVNEDIVYTYIDGVLIDTRQQSDGATYPYGEVAIRQDYALWNSSNPEKAYFDNIKIYDLTDDSESELMSLDFEDGINPFDSGNIVNGRLYVSGSYAWPRKTYDISDNSYDLGMSLRVIRDSAGVLFSADDRNNTHMWSLVVKGSSPILRRHIRQGGNWRSSDVNLSTFTSCSSLKSKTHDFQIKVRGNVIDSYLDGEKIDSYVDNSGTLHYGKTGFRTFHDGSNNEEFLCDNITLRKYNTPDASDEGILVFAEDFESAGHVYPDGVVRTAEGNKMLSLSSAYDEKIVFAESETDGMPLMRCEITAKGEIKEARISAAALGVFDLRVNGNRVGSTDEDGTLRYDELKPGWTDYRSSVNYYSYDITDLMREGKNGIGAELSNGWWAGAIAHGVYGSDTPLSFIARIDISYADGSSETVITDELWKSANCGPLIYGDIYNGERYDGRRDYSWSTSDYDDSGWKNVRVNDNVNVEIVSPAAPSVRIRPELSRKPQTIKCYTALSDTGSTYGSIDVDRTLTDVSSVKLKAGETALCDFGQNMVGNVKLTLKADRGCKVRIRFGEMLNDSGSADRANDGPEGSLYTYNLRTAEATVHYTAGGDPSGETYSPTTSFFGFRYCEISSSADIDLTDITAQVIGSEVEEFGELTTSHQDVNKLINNIRWGQRGNFLYIPTDCPQRDERLGWTGDTQIFSRAATYASDTRAFYRKWMDQMRQGQRGDGAYPDIAPFCNFWGYGNSAWGDAGVIVPWNVYVMTGDKQIVEENYDANKRYMQFLANQADGRYKYNGAGTSFGDWLAYEDLDARYVSVAYYAYDATLMANMADALDLKEDAAMYRKLHDDIAAEFRDRYMRNDKLSITSQTACLLALAFDLLATDTQRQNVIETLRDKYMANGYKLQTGFVGTGLLNTTLSACGLDDIAYNLLLQRDNPSWLYSVDQGATTIWERWDSYTLDEGFNKHPWIMNSFNHYAYGVIYEWMMRYMAGIEYDEDAPGFKHIKLQPHPDKRQTLPAAQKSITSAAASTRTPQGTVSSEWKKTGSDSFTYKVKVPVGSTATMYIPVNDENCTVSESGKPIDEAEGVSYKGFRDGKLIIDLLSGSYEFNVVDKEASVKEVRYEKIRIAPNPFFDVLSVEGISEGDPVSVVGINGQVVYNDVYKGKIDTSSWPENLYIVCYNNGNVSFHAKGLKRN